MRIDAQCYHWAFFYYERGIIMIKKNTRILVECAMMIAVATVLSFIKVINLPQGGSVTCASMMPLILISYRHGVKWGVFTGFVHSLLQMLILFYAPPANTLAAFAGVILLDYVLAFTVLGTASFFGKPLKNRATSVVLGTVIVTVFRFVCSFLSGILIWSSYAPEGTPIWIYSLTYNGSYMLPEIIITAVVSAILIPVLDRLSPVK
jgi:thiamine transporter